MYLCSGFQNNIIMIAPKKSVREKISDFSNWGFVSIDESVDDCVKFLLAGVFVFFIIMFI